MKQPKKLTWKQKQIVGRAGKNPDDYMLHAENEDELILYNKKGKATGVSQEVDKEVHDD